MSGPRFQQGFTLIEVVCAFAIFALCAGALYESFGAAVRRSATSSDIELAVLVAQSKLAELRARAAPWPREMSGHDTSGLSWRIDARPLEMPIDEHSPWRPYEVTVSVRDRLDSGDAFTLRSIELSRNRS